MPAGPNGRDFFERYDAAIAKAARKRREPGAVAVVSHGAAIRVWAGCGQATSTGICHPARAGQHRNRGAGRRSRRRLEPDPLGRQPRGRPCPGGSDGGWDPTAVRWRSAKCSHDAYRQETPSKPLVPSLNCITLRRIEAVMQTNPRLNIRQVTWANPVGADLRAAQQAELDARFGRPDHEAGTRRRRKRTRPCSWWRTTRPQASRWAAAACAAGRPDRRNQAPLRAALHPRFRRGEFHPRRPRAHAFALGITRITAEAGSVQTDGRKFYANSGFDQVPNFGPYVGVEHSYCFAKQINCHSAAHTAMA
jgi:hypothetical protein